MPKILESEALTIARSIDQAPETDRPWMLDLLDRYQQQQRDDGEPDWPSVERARVERETNLRGMFESPDKITYDPGPFSQNPQEAKMLHANMALLSARYQKEPREVAERYDFLINDYARQKLGASEDVDTAKFYALAQKDMQKVKLREDTQREGMSAALRGEDGVKALAAWQAKNADRAKDDAGLFMRGYQQAIEQDGEMLPIADRLLKALESGTDKTGQNVQANMDRSQVRQELGQMVEQLAGMKKAQRKSVYRSIAARIEAAGYDQKGFWSQMLGELDKGLYRMEGTLGTQAGQAFDVMSNFPAMLAEGMTGNRDFGMTPAETAQTDANLARRERIGNVQEEIMQIVSGELDPVRPTTGWMNETIETGLIKGPGAVAPFMAASALLGPYGAGLVFTADFAEQNRRELVQSGLDADQARKVGAMAAPLQAAVESLSNMVSLGKFPAVQSALSRFTRPVGGASLVGRYVQNSLISGATEFTEEQVQDNVVAPAMQELLGVLEKDVPEVDWSFYKTRAANATPELAATLLPMALVFGGVMTAADARLSDRMTSNVDALTALNYSQAQATEIVQEKTPEARIAKAASLWRSREGNKISLEQGATKLAERLKALSSDAVAYQAELERRGVLPRVMHTAENDWLLTFNDGSTARFATHDEASTARWTWAEDQLGRVHALTREALTLMERNMSTNRELGVEFKPDVRMVEAGQTTPDIQRRVEQGKVLGDIDPNEAFDTASMVDRATAEADGFLSSYQILGSSRNEFKDGVLRTTIKLWEGSNVLTLVEEKLEGDAKAIVASRGGRGWMLAALRNYEQESGDKLFREVPDDQLTDDDLVEAWSHLGQSYLVGRSSFGEPLQQNNMRRFSRLLMRAGLAGALNSESTFWQAVVNRAQKLGELKAAGKLNEDVVAELEKQLGIDSQVKHEQGAMQEVQQVRDEVAQQVDTSGYSEATPGPNGETFSIAPSLLSVKPPRGVVANTTDALPSWTLPKISGSVSKVLNSPKVRAEFYAKLDKAIEWLKADPSQITTAKGWVTFMRKAGVWGEIPMPPSGLADIIANPAAYVAKLNGGYHGAASLSDTQTSAKQGMDGTVEMRKLIGDGKAPAPFVVALHNMWGILSRMLSPIDQEGMWLRLIAHRPVLDAIQSSIDGTFAMTVDQWKQVVQDARASSAVESGPIGNAATSNANDFYLMLSRLNGRWNDMADVYAAPNSREMGRRFWNIGAGKLGIKNKVQRFIGLTFGTPGVIMDRWKFVEFWLPTAMEGMQANEPSSYFNYSANTPSDPVGVYAVYGGIDSDNEALSLAMYEAFEVVLEESIAKSEELQFHLGEHANAGGMHWFGWNAIKNEAVGHSSLDLTKELIATFGLDIDAEKVHTTVTNGTYYTEGSPSAGNTVKFVLERGKVRVERTTLAGGFQSGQAGRNAKAAGRGIAEGRTGTFGAIGDTFSIRKPTKKQLDKILPGAKYIAPDELMDADIRGPVVIGAYHGTTHTIEQFTDERAYLENDMGAGVYASTSIEDVNANYAGEGPDLTQRIELTKEQLVNDGMDEDEAEREARSMLKGHGGAVIPLLIPMRNPVVLWKGRVGDSTNRGTFIEFRGDVEQYRDEAEELVIDREGITRDELPDYQDQVQDAMYEIEAEKDFDGVLAKIARVVDSFDDTDSGAFVSSLDQDGMYAADLEQELRNNEGTVYATSGDNGQLAVGELIRRVFMDALGFDGIIDKNVNTKFGSRSRGKAMAGMDDNTAHVIVATDTELRPRSAFNTDTTFSLRPGDFASRVEAMFSPFQRSPEARLVMARVAKDRALRVMPQLLELQAQFDNNEKQRQDLETKFAEESAQLRADLEANEKQIRQDRDFEIKGVAQDKGSELDRERIRRDADNKLASLRLEYERNIRELEKRKESETAKLSRKDTSAQREKTRQLLRVLDGILAASPPEVRARVGGFVKMAGIATDEAALRYLEDRVAKLDKELEKWLKKDATGSINRLFKKAAADYTAGKKAKGKLGPDEHYLFQRAEAASEMDAAALRGELAKLDALSVDDSLSDDQRVLAVLERGIVELVGDMKNADSGRLFTAFDELTRLYSQGVVAWKAKQTARREARQAVRDALKADAGKSGVLKERQAMEKAMTTLFGKAKSAWLSVSSFSEVLRYAFGSKSQQATELIDGEREASNAYEDEQQAIADELEALFTSMAGGKVLDGERLRFDMAQRTIKAGDVDLSQFEAITALLMWRQEDGRRHMEGTFDENGQRTSGWFYDQAWIDEVEKQLTPEGRRFMAWLAAKYGSEHGELNALYRERHGVNLPAHDNYAPLTVKPMQAKAGEIVDPVSGAAVSGSILTPGSLRTRSRMAVAEPEFRDALQTFVAHKKQMGYWKAYYDLATDVQAVLGNRELMNSVEAAAGKEAVVTLRKWMDVLAQGGVRDAAAGLAMNGMFQRMMNRAATVGLLGRVSTLLVQSTQLAAASVQMPVGAYLRRFGKLLAGQLDWKSAIQSDFIQRRMQSAPPIVRQAMENLGTATRPNLIKQAVRKLGNLLTGADGLFTGGTYAILLDYHRETGRKLGLTGADLEEHAHREAKRATEEVAQPTRTATRSLAEITATNPLAKVSFAYASEARQKIALLGWAAVNFKADPVRFGKAAFLVFGVGGVMSQVLKNIWKEAKGDDDEEKWSPERLVRGSVANALHGIPMMSEIMGEPGMFSSTAWAQASLDDLLKGEADLRDINTLLGTLGLFNDTAAGVAAMSNAGYDFAKIIEAAFSE